MWQKKRKNVTSLLDFESEIVKVLRKYFPFGNLNWDCFGLQPRLREREESESVRERERVREIGREWGRERE